jgi:EpsI family protein
LRMNGTAGNKPGGTGLRFYGVLGRMGERLERRSASIAARFFSDESLSRFKAINIRFGLLLLLLFFLYLPTFGGLAKIWWSRDDYSHGFLIPLISLYLAWMKRGQLRNLVPRPDLVFGIPAVFLAGLILLVGRAGGVIVLEGFSLIIMIGGLILLTLGRGYLKPAIFPVAYLLFMLPVSDELMGPFQWQLRIATAKMSVASLQMLGFPALLDHQYIVLPKITLEVAQACSGASFLIAIVAIGIPLASLSLASRWNQLFLILSGLVVGVVSNWLRVVLIGIGVFYGFRLLHGPFHVLHGLLVAQLGFVYLFAAAWFLSKTPAERRKKAQSMPMQAPSADVEKAEISPWSHRGSWTAVILLLVLLLYAAFYDRGPVPLRDGLETFPLSIKDWKGGPEDANRAIFRLEGADQEMLRSYRSPSGQEIQLYVAYFASQHQGKEIVNYRTARLHRLVKEFRIPLGPMDQKQTIVVNEGRMVDEAGEHRVLFWYDLDRRVIPNRYRAKFETVLDGLWHGRTNGAFVLISGTPLEEKDGQAKTEEEAFVQDVLPALRLYLR